MKTEMTILNTAGPKQHNDFLRCCMSYSISSATLSNYTLSSMIYGV